MDLVKLKIFKERSVLNYVATFMVIKTLLGTVVYYLGSHPKPRAVYFGEIQCETAPHFFGLRAVYKKRSGQFISRRKATL